MATPDAYTSSETTSSVSEAEHGVAEPFETRDLTAGHEALVYT